MKFKCLVLDHDDTAVRSTPIIHYPSFVKTLAELRPQVHYTMEEFLLFNFDPGLMTLYRDILHFTDAEMQIEIETWQRYVNQIIPEFFPGIPEIVRQQKAEGGLVCVVSHSYKANILRDYHDQNVPEPDLIFGWEKDRSLCKPNPYPLQEIMRLTGVKADEMLMVDDLKPGYDMARCCNVAFAAAGWAYSIPQISEFMEENSDYYPRKVAELAALLFS